MNILKRIKIDFNTILLKATSLVAIGAFLVNTACAGLANPSQNVSLRPLAVNEKNGKTVYDAAQRAARRIPIVAAQIKALAKKYGCKDDEIEILSIPYLFYGIEDLSTLRKGVFNFIYHIKAGARDAVVRLPVYSTHKPEDYLESMKLAQQKLFSEKPDNDSGLNPILDSGLIEYFIEGKDEETRVNVYIEMPFVEGVPIEDLLHDKENAAFKFILIRGILRICLEFHRRLILMEDYHIEQYLADVSNQKCPVKIIDYLDNFRFRDRCPIEQWLYEAEEEVKSIAGLLKGVMLIGGDSFYTDYLDNIEPYVRQLAALLNEADIEGIESLYTEKIFPAVDRLIEKQQRAIPSTGGKLVKRDLEACI